jgi:hypothetical protein
MFFILLTNLLLMIYLKADEKCPGTFRDIYCDSKPGGACSPEIDGAREPFNGPLKLYSDIPATETPLMDICIPESSIDFIVTGISTVQTVIAIIVMLSYYFENREKFRYVL